MTGKAALIRVDPRYCKRCGICIEFCPKSVLAPGDDDYPSARSPGSCTLCRLCELRCPDLAVEVEERENAAGA